MPAVCDVSKRFEASNRDLIGLRDRIANAVLTALDFENAAFQARSLKFIGGNNDPLAR